MSHLGWRISALVDGQLPPDETERVLVHVVGCPECSAELGAARAARAALAGIGDVPSPDPGLSARLLALAADAPVRRTPTDPFAGVPAGFAGPFPVAAASSASSASSASLPSSSALLAGRAADLRGDVVGGHGRSVRLVVASVAGVGAVAAALFAMGAQPVVVPTDRPGTTLAILGAAAATSSDAGDELAAVAAAGWPTPDLPDGWSVTDVDVDDAAATFELAGPGGAAVVVVEQRGRLSSQTGVPVREVGGREVEVLSYAPSHVAWQCHDAVVEVLSAASFDDLADVVAAFPAGGYDDGVGSRISRGWTSVAAGLGMP